MVLLWLSKVIDRVGAVESAWEIERSAAIESAAPFSWRLRYPARGSLYYYFLSLSSQDRVGRMVPTYLDKSTIATIDDFDRCWNRGFRFKGRILFFTSMEPA